MALITLVGKKLAKVGNEFVYMGITQKCRNCKLKTVCSNLQEGRTYKIVKIRNKFHECWLHDGGVVAVEVEKQPALVNIRKEEAEGTAVEYKAINCDNISCREYENCVTPLKPKEYKILEVKEDVKCPLGYKLKKVLLEDIR